MNQVETVEDKVISKKMKYYLKCKANEYPCPDCGKIMNNANAAQHKKSQAHQFVVLKKLLQLQNATNATITHLQAM